MLSAQAITVRIKKPGGSNETVGAGWLYAGDLIVTCAHVINSALGRTSDSTEEPSATERVVVRAPIAEGSASVESPWRVVGWKPVEPSQLGGFQSDVAFLEPLGESFPRPTPVDGALPAIGERCDTYGFPAEYDVGRSGFGKIGDLAGARYEIRPIEKDQLPTPGFSGAPVISGGYVVGIVSSVANAGGRAYLTPLSALKATGG
jgi:Trypsin-like peptidase domain